MHRLTTFIHVLRNSIFSFPYYRKVLKTPFGFSFKYFMAFSLIVGIIMTVIFSVMIVPPLDQFIKRVQTRAPSLYPQDLVIDIKDGQLSTNVPSPIRFPLPVELFTDTPGAIPDQKQLYLVTIDTTAQPSDIEESRSFILVTKEAIVFLTDEEEYRVYPLPSENTTIDKAKVTETWNQFLPWLSAAPILIIGGLLLTCSLLIPLTRLISLAFLTLPLLVIAQLMKRRLSYRKLFQIGLHSLTLPTLIQIIFMIIGWHPPIPMFYSLLFILYNMIILAELPKS